eukprot:gene1185-4399_t
MEHHKQFRKQTKQLSDVLFPVPESQAYMLPRPEHFPPNAANASKLTDLQREIASQIPNFLIIGVQKCGTSALYFSLCKHPNVTCAARVKEPFFLSQTPSTRYLARYASYSMPSMRVHFHLTYAATCFNLDILEPGQATLEASTTYFESDTAFDIISSHLLNAHHIKLLVILREPVSRAYSHYQHDMRRNGLKPNQPRNPNNPYHSERFDSFISATKEELDILRHCREVDELHARNNLPHKERFDYEAFYQCVNDAADIFRRKYKRQLPGYLFKGLYYGRIRKWAQAFPNRLHIMLYDQFRFDPVAELNTIQYFLGLPNYNYKTILDDISHEYQEGSRYPKLGGAEIRQICEEFFPHNQLLAKFTGIQIPWNEKLRLDFGGNVYTAQWVEVPSKGTILRALNLNINLQLKHCLGQIPNLSSVGQIKLKH